MAPRITVGLALTALFLSVTAPAPAASGALIESCTVMEPHYDIEYTAVLDSDLPASLAVGQKATFTMTAAVTIPEVLMASAVAKGATSVEGLAQIITNFKDSDLANMDATIAPTTVPGSGDRTIQLTSSPRSFTPQAPGAVVITGYVYLTQLVFKNPAGTNVGGGLVVCKPKVTTPAQDTTIDTLNVAAPAPTPTPSPTPTPPGAAQAATTTAVTATYKKHAKKLKTRVTVKNADGSAATGKVEIVVRRGTLRIGSATVSLRRNGTASKAFKHVAHRGHYVVIASYGGSPASKASVGRAHFAVP